MKPGMAVLGLMVLLCGTARAQDMGSISHEGVVEGPLEQVWAAFTTTDGLRAWLAPHVGIDLRVGGLMRTNYKAEGRLGDADTIENAILSFEPQRMISIKVARSKAGQRAKVQRQRCRSKVQVSVPGKGPDHAPLCTFTFAFDFNLCL